MECELFGYETGACTGANISKPGKVDQAGTGTGFLDEIGDVTGKSQAKLLRVLQEREFERLGSNNVMQTDVRVVAATNVDLRAALESGTFREDLYYRLNVVPINIPPLRERKDDIPYLVEHFAKKFSGEISDGAMERLVGYYWPGNVRELENVVERSILLARGPRVEAADARIDTSERARPTASSDQFLPDGLTLDQFEQHLIKEALKRADGNKSQAARLLGLTRNALRYRLTAMGIE